MFRLTTAAFTLLLITISPLSMFAQSRGQSKLKIEVIYPKTGQQLGATDSSFIFGNVTPGASLKINGADVEVYKDGAFLAYLPLQPGQFTFRLVARLRSDSVVVEQQVVVPEPYITPPEDSLVIRRNYTLPTSPLMMMEGDELAAGFRGTPGLHGYFQISTDSGFYSMTESPPEPQTYWARELFGDDYPDSLLIRGRYTGVTFLNHNHVADSSQIVYFLCLRGIKRFMPEATTLDTTVLRECQCISDTSKANLKVISADSVIIAELTDSTQTIRVGPRRGYLSIFQPRGLHFRITGYANHYFRAKLADDLDCWLPDSSLKFLPYGTRLPQGEFALIRTFRTDEGSKIVFNPGAEVPYRIEHDPLAHELKVSVYNCRSNIDWIRYDTSDSLVDQIFFRQVRNDVVELTIHLTQSLWGYDAHYEGTEFTLNLKKRPKLEDHLKGLRIVIDPGHSPDPGAIGPTGFMEKDANLQIADKLRRELIDRGATVIMTRFDNSPLPLYDRPIIANKFHTDLFISVHNNALPDGVNPFYNNGTSTYYYHPQSFDLARCVQKRVVEASGLPDYGLFHGNFAVIRPTQYPAILVECAFMIIPQQEMELKTESYQKRLAKGIADGVEDFIKLEKERERREKHIE